MSERIGRTTRWQSRLAGLRRGLGRRLGLEPAGRVLEAPLASLRCRASYFAERQGFSGGTINRFPPCGFFVTYLEDPERAQRDFTAWYWKWFVTEEGWRVPKGSGGMGRGSLERTLRRLSLERHGRPLGGVDEAGSELIEEAIRMRVEHYLALLRSIRDRGFDPGSPLPCEIDGDLYVLRNGHHRASALYALGHGTAPIRIPT